MKKIQNIRKYLAVFMAFILIVLPFGGFKVFAAYDSGFSVPSFDHGNGTNGTGLNTVDGSLTTSYDLQGNGISYYTAPSDATTLNAWFSSAGSGLAIGKITFYSSATDRDSHINAISNTGTITVNGTSSQKFTYTIPSGGRYFTIESLSYQNVSTYYGFRINELEVNSVVNHDEISNLLVSQNGTGSTITYDIPSGNTHYVGSKIYRDGVLIKTQSALESSFSDSGLSYSSSYTYKVTALYDDSFETTGLTYNLVTGAQPVDPKLIPPSAVTSLSVGNIKSSSVDLSWTNSNDTDLASVNVYENGSFLKNIPLSTSTTVTGLTSLTSYNFSVSLVDVDGNESSLTSVNATTLLASDTTPPSVVTGVKVSSGDGALFVSWSDNTESDFSGYNVYLDGVKVNTSLISNTFYTLSDLNNDQSYSVQVSAVDKSGNESVLSTALDSIPKAGKVPIIKTKYSLSDVATGVSEWFKAYWLIIAFAAAIPLSFYIAARVKLMFIE